MTILALVQFDKTNREKSIRDEFQPPIGFVLPPFLLKGSSGNDLEYPFFKEPEISAIFILPKPCLPCNPNFYFLEKLAKHYNARFHPVWIVSLNPGKSKETIIQNNPYDVYTPADLTSFKRLFKLGRKTPQVTLLKGRKVIFS
jgi:hypothetical protein